MNAWDLLKSLYGKFKPSVNGLDLGAIIAINQWLSLQAEVHEASGLMDYIFDITPEHYYYLLYFSVPQRRFDFVKKPKSEDMSQNLLLSKVQYILGWTDRELKLNRQVLKETILKNESYWKQQLGVE